MIPSGTKRVIDHVLMSIRGNSYVEKNWCGDMTYLVLQNTMRLLTVV